jgi:AcrR family transcriptional regulator
MQQEPNSTSGRRPRADGERNRARLIAAAKAAFAERGAAASLEGIASEANVSIASLYRHFPTRDALIEAVYRQETDTLIDAATKLMAEREPNSALREWLLLFVEFLDAKHGMSEALNTLIGGPNTLYSETPGRLAPPITTLVSRAIETGGDRIDVEPIDLLRAIAGVANHTSNTEWKQSAIRMVHLLLKGLQDKEYRQVTSDTL